MTIAVSDKVRERVLYAMALTKMDPTKLSRYAKKGKDYFRDFLEGRKIAIGAAELLLIEDLIASREQSNIDAERSAHSPTVPLVGFVGAGALYVPFETGTSIDQVRAPEDYNEDTVAVEIRGDSLGVLFDQWLVYYDRVYDPPHASLINKLCVVGLADTRIMVKQLKRGQIPGLWNLMSNAEPPIYDVAVMWAARVKNMSPR